MGKDKKSRDVDADEVLLANLTGEQKALLLQAVELVKQRVFADVTKRMRNYVIAAASLLTIFGAVSFVGFKTAVKDAAMGALMEDKELRQSIKSDAAVKVTKADNMLKEIEAILEKAKAEKVAIADSAVAKINSVLEDARQARREEDALFEHSARELNTLIMELQRLKREGRPQ